MRSVRQCFSAAFLAMSLSALASTSHASPSQSILPTDDGAIYTCCSVVTSGTYLLSAGQIQGDVKFSTSEITGHVSNAYISVTAVGFPVWDPNVEIYGFESSDKLLDLSDIDAGNFLGIMDASSGDAVFDVTNFLNQVQSPYVGFRLVTPDNPSADVFGSTGTSNPAQLVFTVSPAPEPFTWALMLFGLGLTGGRLRSQVRMRNLSSLA